MENKLLALLENKLLALLLTLILLTNIHLLSIPLVKPLTEWHVYPGDSIQAAIDAASPGDTITVHQGTYDEQVVIDKSLTLQGVGDTTIVKPSSADKLTTVLSGHFWGGTKQIASIIVANVATGSSVTVKNLKVDGENVTARPPGADYVAGIFYRETGGTIESVTVTDMTVGTTGTTVRGYGIYLSATANTVSVEVKGSTITNYDKNGIDAHGNKLTVNIHHNTVTGRGPLPSGDEVQNGILIMDGAIGTVNTNTISNMAYTPETWWSAGIMFLESDGSAVNNIVTDCQIGVIFQDGNGLAQDNTVAGGPVGLLGLWSQYTKAGTWTVSFVNNTVSGARDSPGYENGAIGAQTWNDLASLAVTIDDNQLTGGGSTSADGIYIGDIPEYGPAGSITAIITNNVISGWQHGIRLVSSVTDATITGNTIENNLAADSGIHIEPAVTVTNIHVNYNNIFGNNETGVYGIFNNGIGTLDARYNWWGHPTGPHHPTLNPSGEGDQVSDNVNFEPWLTEPYPPPTAVEALLYIDPAEIKRWTPSYGQNFTIEVKVENVTDLFGYEFKLYWNTTLLDLANVEITPPWTKWFVGKNETDENLGRYWLGACLLGAPTFSGNTTLAKLTFKITYDPLYPENQTCKLDLADTILTAPLGELIYHMTHDGTYHIESVKPKIVVRTFPSYAIALGETINVEIGICDVVNLYEFSFKLAYNTTMLDVTEIEVNFLKEPYLYYYVTNETAGYVTVWVWSLSPAPSANGTGVLAIITMKATKASIWPDPPLTCALHLYETSLKTKEQKELLHTAIDGTYTYQPKPGDLNADGKVDLIDLRIVAYYYDPLYNRIADLNRDDKVNIIDLSIVAYYYEE